MTGSLSILASTWSIKPTTVSMVSFRPFVVMAGTPTRMPLVTNGLLSKGTAFLFRGDMSPVQCFLCFFARDILIAEVDQHEVVIGSAADDLVTPLTKALAIACALVSHLFHISAEFIAQYSPKATALAAITCSSGPPWCQGIRPYQTGLLINRILPFTSFGPNGFQNPFSSG